MLKKITLSIFSLLLISSFTFGQSARKMEVKKEVNPKQDRNIINFMNDVQFSKVQEATQLFNTDYDYPGNTSIPNMVWPYDINGDGTWDPVGVAMQRLSTSEDGTRRVQGFFGVGTDITNLPISDPAVYTGWGHIQSISEGPLAGKAMVMMHAGGETHYSLLDLTSFNVDPQQVNIGASNFPSFVYKPDGTIYWTADNAALYKSTDQLASSDSVGSLMPTERPNSGGPSEFILRMSPDGEYIANAGSFVGAGAVFDGAPEDSADFVGLTYSEDGGDSWNFDAIALDGHTPVANRDNYLPYFENFSQNALAVDANGGMHVTSNGYGIETVDTNFVYPALYWNSYNREWMAVSIPEHETLGAELADLRPGNGIGNSYPVVSVGPNGSNVVVLYQAPEVDDDGNLVIYPGDGSDAAERYYTDIYYTVSNDAGKTWSTPEVLAGEPETSEAYPYVYGHLEMDGENATFHYVYMVDAIPGCSLFGGNSGTEQTAWYYGSETVAVTSVNDDAEVVNKFELEQNYPNPFNPTTEIKYSLAEAGDVSIKVYDMLGKEVATLVNSEKAAGSHTVDFNASDLSSGMYVYTIKSAGFTSSKKMMLLK